MGNELFTQKKEDISNDINDLFQNISTKNKLLLKYQINYRGENIRLVGSKFYEKIKIIVKCALNLNWKI